MGLFSHSHGCLFIRFLFRITHFGLDPPPRLSQHRRNLFLFLRSYHRIRSHFMWFTTTFDCSLFSFRDYYYVIHGVHFLPCCFAYTTNSSILASNSPTQLSSRVRERESVWLFYACIFRVFLFTCQAYVHLFLSNFKITFTFYQLDASHPIK